MDNQELLIDNIIFIFLKEKEKVEWNILVELVKNNRYDKILSFVINNYARIMLNKDKKNLKEIIILKEYCNNNKTLTINMICTKVSNIYEKNKVKQKNK